MFFSNDLKDFCTSNAHSLFTILLPSPSRWESSPTRTWEFPSKPNWTDPSILSELYLIRTLRFFWSEGVTLHFCWSSSITDRERKKKICAGRAPTIIPGGGRQRRPSCTSMLDHVSRPLKTAHLPRRAASVTHWSTLSVKERSHRSFLPAAVRLYNKHLHPTIHKTYTWSYSAGLNTTLLPFIFDT